MTERPREAWTKTRRRIYRGDAFLPVMSVASFAEGPNTITVGEDVVTYAALGSAPNGVPAFLGIEGLTRQWPAETRVTQVLWTMAEAVEPGRARCTDPDADGGRLLYVRNPDGHDSFDVCIEDDVGSMRFVSLTLDEDGPQEARLIRTVTDAGFDGVADGAPFWEANGVRAFTTGDLLLVAEDHTVVCFNATYTPFWRSAAGPGSGDGQFVAVGRPAGRLGAIWVPDPALHRVQRLDQTTGAFQLKTGSFGTADGEFDTPVAMAWSGVNGNWVWVVDQGNNRIQCFDGALSHRFTVGGPDAGSGEGQFNAPSGICYDADGSGVWVADTGNHRLQHILNDGSVAGEYRLPDLLGWEPIDVDKTLDDHLVVLDRRRRLLVKIDPATGTVLSRVGPHPFSDPTGVTAGQKAASRRKVWVADGTALHEFVIDDFAPVNEVQQDGEAVGSRPIINFTGTGVGVTEDAVSGAVTVEISGGGTPAGSDGQIQYNDGGVLGGDTRLIWDDIDGRLGVGQAPVAAALEIASHTPGLGFNVQSAAANNKLWYTAVNTTSILWYALSDDMLSAGVYLQATRSGAAITQVSIPAPLAIGAGGSAIQKVLSASVGWNPPSLANGATTATTVTVTGATVNGIAQAGFDQLGANNWDISAHVQATNVVRVVLTNRTGATVDLPSGTLRVMVTEF